MAARPTASAADRVRHEPPRLATVGDVDLCYDAFGAPERPTMLLIMGLGFQLIHWPADFCRQLAAEGFRVVRFDNRDAGRSTHLPGQHYTLEDMADDAVGLLDALGLESAHVAGASLGEMVAQMMAIRHPGRVRSLGCLMSTTGRRGKGRTALRVFRHALARPPRTEEEAIERRVRVFSTIGSTGFEQDLDELRHVSALAFERDPDARDGRRRQHRAVRVARDRTEALRPLTVPTVVIHGTEDPMCHPSGGRATAETIPGARLELITGMGHDLPCGAWPQFIRAIIDDMTSSDGGRPVALSRRVLTADRPRPPGGGVGQATAPRVRACTAAGSAAPSVRRSTHSPRRGMRTRRRRR
jgi:pimeloyl-ACP methyl ester carboxylesterase